MCAHSLLKPLIIKLLIAKLHFRSSIEEYLILVSINRLEKVDRHQLKFRDLINLFKDIKLKSFSGNAIVQIDSEPSRMFSFNLGSLAGVSGGIDPLTRWQRNLELANLKLSLPAKSVSAPGKILIKSYLLAQKLATIEVLFDLIQICQCTDSHLSYQLIEIDPSQFKLNPNLPLLDLQPLLVTAIESWREWSEAGLSEYFPSRFPTIVSVGGGFAVRNSRLTPTAETSPLEIDAPELPTFANIDNLAAILKSIDGNKSLRNLAIDRQQSLLNFTKNILPILRSGSINLCLFPQSQLNRTDEIEVNKNITKEVVSQPIDRTKLLIACIDDSI
jgi:hypothetical protein